MQSSVVVSRADGSNPRTISAHSGLNTRPCWSPDGSRIIYTSDQSGRPELYIVNVDGSNLTKIVDAPPEYSSSSAAWSRNGTLIFELERDGTVDIYSKSM